MRRKFIAWKNKEALLVGGEEAYLRIPEGEAQRRFRRLQTFTKFPSHQTELFRDNNLFTDLVNSIGIICF